MPPDLRAAAAMSLYRGLGRPVAFRRGGGDAEEAHQATVDAAARLAGHPAALRAMRLMLGQVLDPVEVLGIRFPNRVGLAAGMDKDGMAVPAWAALGFGHVELGTVTALPQPGNERPRLFRLPASRAVINAMGFNNFGVHCLAERLRAAREAGRVSIPVGVSIGKSKITPVEDAVGDYLASMDALAGLADYLAVNVSSPNTPGLRSLQDARPLEELLAAVVTRTAESAAGRPVPVLAKLAPDLSDPALDQALEVAVRAGVAGLIATNTTLSRDGVSAPERHTTRQRGGLSGAPLTLRARQVVSRVASQTGLPVIGVGGVMTGDDARAMLDAGASLVQLYTGLIYRGPGLIREAARQARAAAAAHQ